MNFNFVIYAFFLAIIGFIAFSFLGEITLSTQYIFALGLLLGGVITSWFSQLHTRKSESEPLTPSSVDLDLELDSENKTIYVGNLPYKANEAAIRELFSQYGEVASVRLLRDKQTGKRKGYGFIEMNQSDALQAIQALNETVFLQRTLRVREAKSQP